MLLREGISQALSRLCRLYPLLSGNARLAHSRLLGWLRPESTTAVTRLSNGLLLQVFPRDYIGWVVTMFGDYDPKISWVCRRVLRPGDTVIDVGAHHGLVSLIAAGAVGPSGVVHAFEPQPELAATIRESIRLNRLSNLHVHELALSNADGRMTLHVPADNTSAASLSADVKGVERRIEVEVRHAASYLTALDIPAPRLLKLDVEGHEDTVLHSAVEFLSRKRPAVILFECHRSVVPFWRRPGVQALESLGYAFYQVPKAVLRLRLQHIAPGVEPAGHGYDFVAIAPEPQRAEVLASLNLIDPGLPPRRRPGLALPVFLLASRLSGESLMTLMAG